MNDYAKILIKYIDYIKQEKRLSQNTISSYYIDINKYICYLNDKKINITEINESDILNFLLNLQNENMSCSTISRNVSSIKSFHEFLFFEGFTSENPSKKIKKPKIEKNKMDILSECEVEKLLSIPNEKKDIGIRDKAILEILYATGIKVSELISLNIDDINFDFDYINCKNSKNKRIIPITNTCKNYIQIYMKSAREYMIQDTQQESALFVNAKGQRFTRQGLWKVIKRYMSKLNVDKNLTPTMLRHSFAIHILNNGANVNVVSKILGNRNLSSLQFYLTHIEDNIRKELKEKHPRL